MIALEPNEAYRLWAPTYAKETAISFLDEQLARELSPPLAGKRLLDAGCGTGRRLATCNAALTIGIDLVFAMLSAGNCARVAVADVRALPFPDEMFDIVWCRLVLGHLHDPSRAYDELAHVLRVGGSVLVTDFHAAAVAAGHRRSFRDRQGEVHEVCHHVHDGASHERMAAAAGLTFRSRREGMIGPSVEMFYANSGRQSAYENDRGLPVVDAFLYQRTS